MLKIHIETVGNRTQGSSKLIIVVESCNDDEADTIEDAMLSYHQGLVQTPGGSDNIVTGPPSHERQSRLRASASGDPGTAR